ncbi:MOSC domain-containing protein YiiM [Pectinatus brassicae]|uniref:MOSC domain-containing protein YiiM n=1 Tax=Pectinatus brassicae TaxID=862415 RepID=A0A840UHC5_9FIRM|nr:MOSC domain-containing protein [Pectinatus brassicae]MBB5335590.1 MOSC domain-containing protein YiiM [Pectinatus brassicae]
MAEITAICISKKRGTVKNPIPQGTIITNFGLENDAHAGDWHRQISLLPIEAVEKFSQEYNLQLTPGVFGENLLIRGIDLKQLPIGTKLQCTNGILLEITQIGKKCHSGCEIQELTGKCIMPHEGVFAKVLHGGIIKANDNINIIS